MNFFIPTHLQRIIKLIAVYIIYLTHIKFEGPRTIDARSDLRSQTVAAYPRSNTASEPSNCHGIRVNHILYIVERRTKNGR